MGTEQLFSSLPQILETKENLSSWNDELEAILLAHRKQPAEEAPQMIRNDLLVSASLHLKTSLLMDRLGDGYCRCSSDENDNDNELVRDTLRFWKAVSVDDKERMNSNSNRRTELLRASQNFLRWNLQIYAQQRRADDDFSSILEPWKSRDMLELYLCLINASDLLLSDNEKRHASQLLFYSTFKVTAHDDEKLTESYTYLVEKCDMMQKLLEQLVLQQSSNHYLPLTLSLVRNIHNALTSYPSLTQAAIDKVSINKDNANDLAPWVTAATATNISPLITYKSALCDLALHHALLSQEADDDDERRNELIVEILRCCYVLRVNLNDDEGERWRQLVDTLLQQTSYDCQLATIPLLMDATPSDATLNLQSHTGTLLDILERQMDTVFDNQYVDDRAAAALTPILAVLHKFCGANIEFRSVIKKGVFPAGTPVDNDQENASTTTTKNMAPVDAPDGTLRSKIIRLLTWPQSFVKRLTGELLWTLCDGDQQEFVRRVGMGNALPILSLKGLVQLPPNVLS